MSTTLDIQLKIRNDTSANWTAANPVLLEGEQGYETDTGKSKYGDGATAWNSLAYGVGAQGETGGQGVQGKQGIGGAQGATGTGTQGTTGSQGGQGATGAGTQGATGTGTQGGAGSQGVGGTQGTTGAGTQGTAGGQGATGAQGGQGITGAGTQGAAGTTQGATGSQGGAGSQGGQGITGAGSQGATGTQGGAGTQGGQGITGAGTQGGTGSQGATGTGTQGATGGQGTTGTQGGAPTTTTYSASAINIDTGTRNSGDLTSIQTFNDANVYDVQEIQSAQPGFEIDIDFSGVTSFNRATLNLAYNNTSTHVVNIDLWNFVTSAWDTIATFQGLNGYTQFTPGIIDSTPFVSAGAVHLRLYHVSVGYSGHSIQIDYCALQNALQGPEGQTGAQGAAGTQGAAAAQGTTGGQGGTGTQGATGTGSQGATGGQGGTGSQGGTGTQGGSGSQGATGTGSQGATGAQGGTGSQGGIGTGTQGAAGVTKWADTVAQSLQTADNIHYNIVSGDIPVAGSLDVFVDGSSLIPTSDFSTSGAQFTCLQTLSATNVVGARYNTSTGSTGVQGAQGPGASQGIQGISSQGAQGIQGISSQGAQGIQGTGDVGTSSQSMAIATGNLTFAGTGAGLGFTQYASRVKLSYSATQWVEGNVQSYTGTTLIVGADRSGGAGTLTPWNISIAGSQGAQGTQGTQGTQGKQGATSDIRIKQDIRTYRDGVQTVLGVKPCIFKYNGLYDTPTDGRDVIGIIANQLEEVIPEALFRLKGKLRKDDAEETDILHYDLAPVVMATVNAVKELVETVDDLQRRVRELEGGNFN